MSLLTKNKILSEQLEEADKTIIALMNKISELGSKIFKLEQDKEYLSQSVTLRECNLGIKNDMLTKENDKLTNKLKQCEIIANNVLYFHDKSDYEVSLYEILNIIQDKNINESRYDKLSYMEGE